MTNKLLKEMLVVLAACVSTSACGGNDAPRVTEGRGQLVVTSTDASGFRAETRVDDELVTIDVRRSTRTLVLEGDDSATSPSREENEDVDTVRVFGSGGIVYANYTTTWDHTDADGTFGELPFGGAHEEDPEAFSRVLHTRVGHVVTQLVASSRESADRPGLALLGAMKDDLYRLAGEESVVPQATEDGLTDDGASSRVGSVVGIQSTGSAGTRDVCDFKWTSTARMGFGFEACAPQGIDVDDRCRVWLDVLFGKIAPQKCQRTYSARIYSDKGTLLAKTSGKVAYSSYLSALYDKKTYEVNIGTSRWLSRKPGSKVCFKSRFGDSTGRKYSSSVRCQVVKLRSSRTNAGDYEYILWDSWK